MRIIFSDVEDEDDIIIKSDKKSPIEAISSSPSSSSSSPLPSSSSPLPSSPLPSSSATTILLIKDNSKYKNKLSLKIPSIKKEKIIKKKKKVNYFTKILPTISSKKLNHKNCVVSSTPLKQNTSINELLSKENFIKNDNNNTPKKIIIKNQCENNNIIIDKKNLKRKYNETQSSVIKSENFNINNDDNIIIPPEKISKNYKTDDENIHENSNSVTYPISKENNIKKIEENNQNSEYKTSIRKFFKNSDTNNKNNLRIKTFVRSGKYSFKTEQITTEEESDSSKSVKRKHDKIILESNKKLKKLPSLKIQNNNNNNQDDSIHKNLKNNTNNSNFPDINKLLEKKNTIPLSLLPENLFVRKSSVGNKENNLSINKLNLNYKNHREQQQQQIKSNNNTKSRQLLLTDKYLKSESNNNNSRRTDISDSINNKVIPDIENNNSHKNNNNTKELGEKLKQNVDVNNKTTVISKFLSDNTKFLKPVTNYNHNTSDNKNNNNNYHKNNKNNNIMSMYDRRIQDDNRPINGYINNSISSGSSSNVRGLHHHNEDISSGTHSGNSIMSNNYYQCPPPQPTMATLCNIGNTCYLNSVVYTLRFAPMFLHNLHHLVDDLSSIQQNVICKYKKCKYHLKISSLGRNISGLHLENTRSWSSKDLASLDNVSCDIPKSNQQIATEKLHELYQNLHRNEYTETTEPFHAGTFLHAIQDVSAIFEGNQQQDAHEFLMCVLDSIRETCQSLIKSIIECPEVITNGCTVNNVTIAKEKPLQRDSGSSAIIKTSFFSRKSKRKDSEMKNSKNHSNISNSSNNIINNISNSINRTQSPHKDNTTSSLYQISNRSDINNIGSEIIGSGGVVGDTLSGSKHSLKTNLIPDNDLTNLKDNKEHLSEKIKRLGLDFFTEDFEGITVSTTKCLSCETVSEQKETMIDIAVPMTGYEHADLGEKFIQDSCVTKEYFRGENKYRCEQCMGYTEAIRSISYEVLPRLLVIQLSRFSGVMEKINTYLPTPFTLQCFCSKCLSTSSSSTTIENKNMHVYKLYSVITHVGATMSVGHYIAYTCSLDWANDYVNCPKDRMRQAQILKQQQQQSATNITGTGSSNANSILNGPEKNVRLMKKMIFGRSKASSSGDMSKTVKNINGLSSSKSIVSVPTTNNNSTTSISDKQQNNSSNITCPSINCCGLQINKNNLLNNSINYNISGNSSGSGSSISNVGTLINNSCINNSSAGYYLDIEDNHHHHSQASIYNTNYNGSSNSSGYGTTNTPYNSIGGGGSNNRNRQQHQQHQNEPIWYMCDDDKIKAMSQREFEEMLSPNRKIMITPYLLFYARSDIQ